MNKESEETPEEYAAKLQVISSKIIKSGVASARQSLTPAEEKRLQKEWEAMCDAGCVDCGTTESGSFFMDEQGFTCAACHNADDEDEGDFEGNELFPR